MTLNVTESRGDHVRVVLKLADAQVAGIAEKAADLAGHGIVINAPVAAATG
jgi:hypothetical protein